MGLSFAFATHLHLCVLPAVYCEINIILYIRSSQLIRSSTDKIKLTSNDERWTMNYKAIGEILPGSYIDRYHLHSSEYLSPSITARTCLAFSLRCAIYAAVIYRRPRATLSRNQPLRQLLAGDWSARQHPLSNPPCHSRATHNGPVTLTDVVWTDVVALAYQLSASILHVVDILYHSGTGCYNDLDGRSWPRVSSSFVFYWFSVSWLHAWKLFSYCSWTFCTVAWLRQTIKSPRHRNLRHSQTPSNRLRQISSTITFKVLIIGLHAD